VSSYITFRDGSSLLFECSWAANIKEDPMHLSISGAEGGLSVYPFEVYRPWENEYQLSEENADGYHNGDQASYRQWSKLVSRYLGTESRLVKEEEALKFNKIIVAIYDSNDKGSSVRLEDYER